MQEVSATDAVKVLKVEDLTHVDVRYPWMTAKRYQVFPNARGDLDHQQHPGQGLSSLLLPHAIPP